MTGYPFGRIVQLLILTGMHRSEATNLKTEYVQGNTICLPSTARKNKRAFTFPIGKTASSILATAGKVRESYIFPARNRTNSSFSGFSKAKAQLAKKVCSILAENGQSRPAPVQPWTLHDLRRFYATNLQRLGIKLEIIEALLSHVSGTRAAIVGVYQRHAYEAEMREAVNTYEAWFQGVIMNKC